MRAVPLARKAAVAPPARAWFVYLLECKGGTLYAGISPDPAARFALHCSGKGARYTRSWPPLRILAAQKHPSHSAALTAEHQLKKLKRPDKLLWARRHAWKPPRQIAGAKKAPPASGF